MLVFFPTAKLLEPNYYVDDISVSYFLEAKGTVKKIIETLRCWELRKFGNLWIREYKLCQWAKVNFDSVGLWMRIK